MRSIIVYTEIDNGATPRVATVILVSRAEVLQLCDDQALTGVDTGGEEIVLWLADDMDEEQALIEHAFRERFAKAGVPMETWHLGGTSGT